MSPFSLIEISRMRDRAGITYNSHFVLFPVRLRPLLKKLSGMQRRPETIAR